MFKLTIKTGNAAFDGREAYEVARILRDIANRIDYAELKPLVRDSNGQTVGACTFNPKRRTP